MSVRTTSAVVGLGFLLAGCAGTDDSEKNADQTVVVRLKACGIESKSGIDTGTVVVRSDDKTEVMTGMGETRNPFEGENALTAEDVSAGYYYFAVGLSAETSEPLLVVGRDVDDLYKASLGRSFKGGRYEIYKNLDRAIANAADLGRCGFPALTLAQS